MRALALGAQALALHGACAAAPACNAATLADFRTPAAARASCARALAAAPPPAASAESDALYSALAVLDEASFTRPLADDLASSRLIVAELERRQALRPADRRRWHDILLQHGRLDEVRADLVTHPGRTAVALPATVPMATQVQPGEARYWRWDAEADVLREHGVDLGHGVHLVIDASPSCEFCPLAAAAIGRDVALTSLFHDALWIDRPESTLDAAFYRRWNTAHPGRPMDVVLDANNWAMPAQWATPTFRFFRDGQVVETVTGWTAESRADLLAAGARLGMPVR